jgi:zinc transporter ZupT
MVATLGTLVGSLLSRVLETAASRKDIGLWIALAAGMMFGCGVVLTWEAVLQNGYIRGIASVLVGWFFMYILDYLSDKILNVNTFKFSNLEGKKAVKLLVTVVGLVVHSIGEGVSLGLSAAEQGHFSSGVGSVVYISLALHNIPEAAALALAFRVKGTTRLQATLLAIASTLPQSIVAWPAYSLFSMNLPAMIFGTGVASGCMLYAVVNDIFPESVDHLGSRNRAVLIASVATSLVIVFDVYNHILIR